MEDNENISVKSKTHGGLSAEEAIKAKKRKVDPTFEKFNQKIDNIRKKFREGTLGKDIKFKQDIIIESQKSSNEEEMSNFNILPSNTPQIENKNSKNTIT